MGHTHPSTPAQRAQWAATMLAHHGHYGSVTALSRLAHVSRPTLYAWRDQAHNALLAAFQPPAVASPCQSTPRQILTLWITHASERGIQSALRELLQRGISLHTISTVLHEAQQRAISWMHSHVPPTTRALALDEIYQNDRCGAYLNVVDVHSGAVWASEGPLRVDCDSWTLVLWELAERGLQWDRVVLDGGVAMQAACRTATPAVIVQGDVWHVLHTCAQVQARLERVGVQLRAQTPVVARQAERVARGQRPLGRKPKTDLAAHARDLATAERVALDVRYLTHELRELLEVVVVRQQRVLSAVERAAEVDVALALLCEVAREAPSPQQGLIEGLHATLNERVGHLLTFVPHLDEVQRSLEGVLPTSEQAVLAWAWLRRRALGWKRSEIVQAVPHVWQAAARVLLCAWDDAVRVSSAVERWHSIQRPHLAVHRTLSTGMLAVLAVWHNHRVYERGVNKGLSPLHLSGMTDAPTDWLVALGYPLTEAAVQEAASLALAA